MYKLTETSNYPDSPNYYVRLLIDLEIHEEIYEVEIDVNRGINDYRSFASLIKEKFPNIKTLKINQNYYTGHIYYPGDSDPNTELTEMLIMLELNNFEFTDYQSEHMTILDKEQLWETLNESGINNFNYVFNLGDLEYYSEPAATIYENEYGVLTFNEPTKIDSDNFEDV